MSEESEVITPDAIVTDREAILVGGFIQEYLEVDRWDDKEDKGRGFKFLEGIVRNGAVQDGPFKTRRWSAMTGRHYENYRLKSAFGTAAPEGMARIYETQISIEIGTTQGGRMVDGIEIVDGIPMSIEGIEPAGNREAAMAARQLQIAMEEKPYKGQGDFFMDALIKNGEIKGLSHPTARAWRGVVRLEMTAENLKPYDIILPPGFKRFYSLEVTMVCDTIPEDMIKVDDEEAPASEQAEEKLPGRLP